MDDKSRQPVKVASLEKFGETISKIFNNPKVKVLGFKLPKQKYYSLKGDDNAKE